MSDSNAFGFGKLVPGFDFLQNLGKGAAQGMAQMPHLSNWIAPTLNVEDLDKRIDELKAVQFWLDQNGKALGATIQALEVQKMTLATLKGMNFSLGDMAEALKLRPNAPAASPAAASAAAEPERSAAEAPSRAAGKTARRKPAAGSAKAGGRTQSAGAAPGVVDPVQWWGALTHQFKEIAASAMQDVAAHAASASSSVKGTSADPVAAGGKPAGKPPAAKTASRARASSRKKA